MLVTSEHMSQLQSKMTIVTELIIAGTRLVPPGFTTRLRKDHKTVDGRVTVTKKHRIWTVRHHSAIPYIRCPFMVIYTIYNMIEQFHCNETMIKREDMWEIETHDWDSKQCIKGVSDRKSNIFVRQCRWGRQPSTCHVEWSPLKQLL